MEKIPYITKRTTRRVPTVLDSYDSMVQQSEAQIADINEIVARYQKTGILDHLSRHESSFGSITGEQYKDYCDAIAQTNSLFEQLPSAAREFFQNDKAAFLDYVSDLTEDRRDQLAEFGLVPPSQRASGPDGLPAELPSEASVDAPRVDESVSEPT